MFFFSCFQRVCSVWPSLSSSCCGQGMRAGEAEPPGTSCAAAPKTGGNPASSANAGGGGSPVGSSSEWTRTSALDNLSPILEADSAEISRDQLSRSMDVDSFAPAALQPPVRATQELRSCSRLRPTSVEVDAPRRGGGAGTAPTGHECGGDQLISAASQQTPHTHLPQEPAKLELTDRGTSHRVV